ncbi:VOC family protein [Halomonas sp. RA08-2]|uniref:VOC family protein n=1 Tax=Halomonas sp. RA08-2 TaxID=3440842 RepID=UPI003EEB60C5
MKIKRLEHVAITVKDMDKARETWVDVLGIDQEYEEPKPGHGGSRIVFLDPASTGNVLIELAEIPEGH